MSDKYELLRQNPQYCTRLFGIKFEQFENILGKVQQKENEYLLENPLSNRGLEGEFSLANQLLLTFEYLRQYPTFLSLGFSYGISESYANKIFHKIRPILANVVGLKNPEKLKYKDVKKVIVDVTVQPVERPQKNQELQYNGSKKSISQKHN
jgi:Helix-turn-helix of DDE superfamily endonuclease